MRKGKAVKNLKTGVNSMNSTPNQKQMGSKIARSAAVRLEAPFEGGLRWKLCVWIISINQYREMTKNTISHSPYVFNHDKPS